MVQRAKKLAAKPEVLSSIHGTDSTELSPDLHMCMVAHATHTHKVIYRDLYKDIERET